MSSNTTLPRAPKERPQTASRIPYFVPMGAILGAMVQVSVNLMRRKPVMFGEEQPRTQASPAGAAAISLDARPHPHPAEPWWHVFNAATGGYLFYHLAVKYDATSGFMETQFASYSKLPSWVYNQLSQEELGECEAAWMLSGARPLCLIAIHLLRCCDVSCRVSIVSTFFTDSELRSVRVREYGATFASLAELEEKEFLAQQAAAKQAQLA